MGSSSSSTTSTPTTTNQQQVGVSGGSGTTVGVGAGASSLLNSIGSISAGGSSRINIVSSDVEAVKANAAVAIAAVGINSQVAASAINAVETVNYQSLNAMAASLTTVESVASNAIVGAQITANNALQTALGNPTSQGITAQTVTQAKNNTTVQIVVIAGIVIALIAWRKTK